MARGAGGGGADNVRQRVNECMNRLSDRDTEAMAASELDAMARSLPVESLPPFLSAISDARPTDKTPLRRHSLRLLTVLSTSHSSTALTPHLPRMLSAALRRLRDPDSSVRAACADAVRSIAAANPPAFSATLLRPLVDALLHEQDAPAQAAAALSLSSALDAAANSPDLPQHLQRLLPRLLKLLRSPSFKAKPSLLTLLGSMAAAGGAANAPLLGALVPSLVEFLASEDWAARKAAAEALSRVAVAERDLLGGLKSSCITSFESRRFDKVKIVRESMIRMLEVWKDIPVATEEDPRSTLPNSHSNSSSSVIRDSSSDARLLRSSKNSSLVPSTSPSKARKSRSPPPPASPIPALHKHAPQKQCPPSSLKIDQKKNSDWRIEIAVPHASPFTAACQEITNNGSSVEARRALFERNIEDRSGKLGGPKTKSRVFTVQENGSLDSTIGTRETTNENYGSAKDGEKDLSLIRMQLIQIENQQANLLDLLQRFIGNSQNGINSLEARVHGLEMALNEISHDLAVSSGRVPNSNSDVTCCLLPGAEFLSSKFWRRTEGRYSSRLSFSGHPNSETLRNLGEKGGSDTYKKDKLRYGAHRGFVVNPLAELHPPSKGSRGATHSERLVADEVSQN